MTCVRTLVLTTSLAATAVWAGPPFVTDDPGTPPQNYWEINLPFTYQRVAGESDMEAPLFDINYGILSNVQLQLDVPVAVVEKRNDSTVGGVGDALFGAKWRFLEEQAARPQLAIFPQVLTPTGDHQRGLGDGKVSVLLPVLAGKNWDKWFAYGNAAYVVQIGNVPNYWYAGASLNRQINDRLQLGAELFGNSPTRSDKHSDLGFNVGGTWKLGGDLNVLFSSGYGILGDTRLMTYLGIQILIGDSK